MNEVKLKEFWSYKVEYFDRVEQSWKFESGFINEPLSREEATDMLKKHFNNYSYKIVELVEE